MKLPSSSDDDIFVSLVALCAWPMKMMGIDGKARYTGKNIAEKLDSAQNTQQYEFQ